MIAGNYDCSKHCSFISIAFQIRKVKLCNLHSSREAEGNAVVVSVESSGDKVFMDALFRVSQRIPAGIVLISF